MKKTLLLMSAFVLVLMASGCSQSNPEGQAIGEPPSDENSFQPPLPPLPKNESQPNKDEFQRSLPPLPGNEGQLPLPEDNNQLEKNAFQPPLPGSEGLPTKDELQQPLPPLPGSEGLPAKDGLTPPPLPPLPPLPGNEGLPTDAVK